MAEAPKHTPGPWKISDKTANGTKAYVDGATGYPVAQSYCSPSPNIKYNELWGEAEANARLIAAAPELLEALKGFMRNHSVVIGLPHAARAARAAIAKAEGRS